MEKSKNLISLIIPAYKQEKIIIRDVLRIKNVMEHLRSDYEIIIVVDGEVDKTLKIARKLQSRKIIVTGYKNNKGKGYAIRYGIARAKGDIIGFIDSGMDLNPNGLSILLEIFEWENADIVIGSKRNSASKVNYPFNRRIISLLSQVFIKTLFGLNVRDTQVGMKFFKRRVIEDVFPRLLVKKFAFDIEILVVAYYLGYKRIFEAPIELKHNFKGSIVSQDLFRAVVRAFFDSLAIFYRLRILHYYDNQNRKKWKSDPELTLKAIVV